MKRKRLKPILCMSVIVIIIVLVVNFTVPEKLIRLRVDRVEVNQIEYTVVSWSLCPFRMGFLSENVHLFKQIGDQWMEVPSKAFLYHDVGVNLPPFYRGSSKFVPYEALEPGTYKLCFYYHMNGSKIAESVFQVE